MADDPETLTPAEARVQSLLGELGSGGPPHGDELGRRVVRTARWPRPVRRTLLAFVGAAGALAAG